MKFFFLLIVLLALTNCKSHTSANNIADLYYISMKDCPFSFSSVDSGTQIRIIAFSGGEESTPETTFYDQFIGVTNTQDTIRILTPLISTGEQNTWTTPTLYNPDKGIETATIQPKDSSFDFAINLYAQSKANGESPIKTGEDYGKLQQKSNANEKIVMAKNISLFESPHYKTVIGALHFDEVPW